MQTAPITQGDKGEGITVVVGLGRTGLSCARYLAARGVPLMVVDSRPEPPGLAALRAELPEVPVRLGPFEAAHFRDAARLVVSPGVALSEPAIHDAASMGVEVTGDIDLFAGAARAPVVAITGSNGKSTVTTLVGEMAADQDLDVRVGGNLGTPALELLAGGMPDLYVLELSSFQLETTRQLRPATAVVLNISADHMDRYPSLAVYVRAKSHIYEGDGVKVVNRDDAIVMSMLHSGRRVIGFRRGAPAQGDYGLVQRADEAWLARGDTVLMAESELAMDGRHNTLNALAALALGEGVGLHIQPMLDTLRRFRGLPHRCYPIAEAGGVRWIDDSKATNVGAALAALEGLGRGRPLVWIGGGEGKGQDFAPLGDALATHAKAVVLLGRDAGLIETAIAGRVPVARAGDMARAVALARQGAAAGDVVLLSPACASFDMFRDYSHRGECFAAAVAGEVGS
ncbi:MAG: UDP-N-acetylmuramoyl-L-alanine--D-glutamate ligase [Gammaproteobacteria bacterium]|nr:UDP-N-acetylmuramoyl-L-alanine--D-glutamate ligase [Gammaproteobacteria bacterium]